MIFLALGLVCLVVWFVWQVLKDIVPIEQTKFDSYGEFRIKSESYIFPDEILPASVGEKYYQYSVKMDRQSTVSFQLVETACEEQRRKYVREREKSVTN